MRDNDGERTQDYAGPLDLPDDYGAPEDEDGQAGPSLTDDLTALIEDGKTYAEAELAFQKSRAAFTADRAKGAVGYALLGLGFLHLALIAATVGLLFALIPTVGPWGATAIVTITLLVGAAVLLRLVKARVDEIASAFGDDKQ